QRSRGSQGIEDKLWLSKAGRINTGHCALGRRPATASGEAVAALASIVARYEGVVHATTGVAHASGAEKATANKELRRAPNLRFRDSKLRGQARKAVGVSSNRGYDTLSNFEHVKARDSSIRCCATVWQVVRYRREREDNLKGT